MLYNAQVLSTPSELRWPLSIAPCSVAVLVPKGGSKEEAAAGGLVEEVVRQLDCLWQGDVIVDDRRKVTVGKKLRDARRTGWPYVVVVGRGVLDPQPTLELHTLATGEVQQLLPAQLVHRLKEVKNELDLGVC